MGQLDAGFIDNVNIKEVDLGKKGLHLNKKKLRTDLNWFFYKNYETFDGERNNWMKQIIKVTTYIGLLKMI